MEKLKTDHPHDYFKLITRTVDSTVSARFFHTFSAS